MPSDEYVLTSREDFQQLRQDVERLKRNPLGDTQASISLLESINRLNASITRLNEILTSANDDMVKAFNNDHVNDQMSKLMEQNEKIAQGVLGVGELVKEFQDVQKEQKRNPFDAPPLAEHEIPLPPRRY